MKKSFHALAMCQSMFCAIPSPWQGWDEEARERMLLFLPIVGLEIGVIWSAVAWLCILCKVPPLITALFLCAYPYVVTGFIHLDGFMDVTDAVRSWRDLERRREILKDSHVGSFAVIGVSLLILSQFSLFASMKGSANVWILTFIPVVSRCCSALAVTILPPMATSQYAKNTRKASHIVLLTGMLITAVLCAAILLGMVAFALMGCVMGYGLSVLRGYSSLKGMNGDISGYALTLSELAAIAVFVLI